MDYRRRDFGKLALLGLPAIHVMAAGFSSKFSGVQVGINAPYSFHGLPGGADDILKYCAQTRINALELRSQPVEKFLGAPPPPSKRRAPTAELEQARRLAAEEVRKWRVSQSMGGFRDFRKKYEDAGVLIQVVKFDGINEFSDDEIDYCFQMAKALGAQAISCEIPVSQTRRLGAFARKHKLMVGYHGHTNITDPEHFGTPSSWEQAMSYSPYNGANIDAGHFFTSNGYSPAAWIKAHHRRVTHVHLKDRKANNGPNRPWGQGDTPLVEVLQLMKREKYDFQATIEFEYKVPEGSDLLTEISRCVQFCERALA